MDCHFFWCLVQCLANEQYAVNSATKVVPLQLWGNWRRKEKFSWPRLLACILNNKTERTESPVILFRGWVVEVRTTQDFPICSDFKVLKIGVIMSKGMRMTS